MKTSLSSVLRGIVSHRGVRVAAALWVVGYIIIVWLAHGSLPFDRPAVARLPFAAQLAAPTVGIIEIFVLMLIAFLVTRRRVVPDIAARAPDRGVAWRETVWLLAYAMLGQLGGWIVGPAFGIRPFSFHVAGTVFGHTMAPTPSEFWIWRSTTFWSLPSHPTSIFGAATRTPPSISARPTAATMRG